MVPDKIAGYDVMPNGGKSIALALATAVGAFGGFPPAPKGFAELTQNEVVQYALLYVLIYQGGASQDQKLALMITLFVYALNKLM